MMMRHSSFPAILAVLVVMVVVSCGGGDDTPATETTGRPAPAQAPQTADVASPLEQPETHHRMVALLEQVAIRAEDENQYQGLGQARRVRKALAELPPNVNKVDHVRLLRFAGITEIRAGNEDEGIALLGQACNMIRQVAQQIGRVRAAELIFRLGVGYMRKGETENCCNRFTADSCIMPIKGGGIHKDRAGSTGAIEQFKTVLEILPEDQDYALKARWLMNIAYMTLGQYPDGVPDEYRIPDTRFSPDIDFPRFRNEAPELGLDRFNCSGGVIIDDLTGDGEIDILTTTWGPRGKTVLFTRQPDGTYKGHTPPGLEKIYGGLNLMPADYDNDGDLDYVVLRGSWLADKGRYPNSLVRNNGDGTFTDVTFDAGLAEVHLPTQAADWADYDADGDLDLFIGNEMQEKIVAPSQLFQNQGDGTFIDVAGEAGVENLRFAKAASFGDYDNDGDPDLYISNYALENRLYRNNGDGTFTDVAPDLGVTRPLISFPTWFWDFNNDGNLDIFASSYDGRTHDLAAYYLGREPESEPACLYMGDGKGGFVNVAKGAGLTPPMLPMGANFGDINNDGFLDFYLGTGDPDFASLMPNIFYLNQGGKTFANVSMLGGFSNLQKGHGIAFADVDRDGDIDLFEQLGGAYLGDGFRDALFRNPGFGNHWVTVHCIGTKSNRSAIGARVRVDVDGPAGPQSLHRVVNSGGSFGANPLRQTIGVGKATRIVAIEVYWPMTGITQRAEDVPLDAFLRVTEGEGDEGNVAIVRVGPPN